MELLVAELGLPALDTPDVEAVALFVGEAERPLQGLAGLCDWRLCGALSRTLLAGWYAGKGGETLLMPSGGRMGPSRLFLFGAGTKERPVVMSDLLPAAFLALRLAKVVSCALSPPWPHMPLSTSMELWSGCSSLGPERQLLVGDARAIQGWLAGAGRQVAGVQLQAPAAAQVDRPAPAGRTRRGA